eukprot:9537521-Alexandrium_andersonii.AAC.1
MPVADLQAHMRQQGIAGVDAKSFFRDMCEETMKAMKAALLIFHYATVGPGDFLRLPSNVL